MRHPLACAALVLAAATATAPAAAQESEASAVFLDSEGAEIGEAVLLQAEAGVLIELAVSGLPAASWAAFHIHEHGECDPEEEHETAGGHFGPGDSAHGFFGTQGPHAGDMPNQYVSEQGTLRAQVFNTFVSLDRDPNAIRGRALMIHADPDDYTSQPSGAAGRRLACAVIQ
ncbi:superoxide dismutase family protein [Pelagibacterium montanilacus]|uniref:superoxide dismutase family protein n=1 Tax=Pelagibacterium montanilacus TaxID=2185280 RepID=UPI000F8CDF19|nr:superoxide dismutase family protein [Pelagibacterium montanilacus]